MKELVANIPSTKKLIVIDTCNAGQLGQAMQTALLTRGMSEDTAMKVLSRAVGSTILSASTSVQEALEGYQGHGLFTWALVQGLQGKADKGKTGYVRTTDLAAYVELTWQRRFSSGLSSPLSPSVDRAFRWGRYGNAAVACYGCLLEWAFKLRIPELCSFRRWRVPCGFMSSD